MPSSPIVTTLPSTRSSYRRVNEETQIMKEYFQENTTSVPPSKDPKDVGLEEKNELNIAMLEEYYRLSDINRTAEFEANYKIANLAPKLGDKVSMFMNTENANTLDKYKLSRAI